MSDTTINGLGGSQPLGPADSALLATLVLQAPVAFVLYDTDLRYRRINRMLAEINGLPMEAHIGRLPSEVLAPELGAAVEARLHEVLRTGLVISDDDFTAPSPLTGEINHYQSQWFPARDESGVVIGVAVLVTDVTARFRAEKALRESNERTAELQRATAALSGALTIDDVRRAMTSVGASALGATRTELDLLPDHRLGPAETAPDEAIPVQGTADPTMVDLALLVSGTRIGTLRLTVAGERWRHNEDRVFLEALAGQCAIAVERARLYERERSTAAALQRSLLPDRLPELPGVTLAASFRPGSLEAEVGGDWYDAFALPDGRLALVVGDVMGKGVGAAAGMGRLRAALRALALVDPLPESVLRGLDLVFTATEDPDQIATLVYLLADPASGRIAVAAAGHLPLVLLRAGGAPELVDAGGGSTPLGWPEPRWQRTLELGPGDTLVGLTDGVVERRGYDLDEGLAEVLLAVGKPADSLGELVDRVAQTMLGQTAGRDDATLLALRFDG